MAHLWLRNLAAIRKERGLTQEQVARACVPPLTVGSISVYERGKNPLTSTAERIADVLGVDVLELYGVMLVDEDDEPATALV